MAQPAAVATEALALHGATLGAGAGLFDTVGHVAPPHIRRPAQHVFGRSTQPRTDLLADASTGWRWASAMAPSIKVMAVDTSAFW